MLKAIVITELFTCSYILAGKHPNAGCTCGCICPLLRLTVRAATVVDEACYVTLAPGVYNQAWRKLHEVNMSSLICLLLPPLQLLFNDDFTHKLNDEAGAEDGVSSLDAPASAFSEKDLHTGGRQLLKWFVRAVAPVRTGLGVAANEQ